MKLGDYRRAIRRGWWMVVVSLILAVGATGLINASMTPTYATSMTFFITTPADGGTAVAYQGGLFSQQRVKSYVDLLTGDRLARRVAENQDLGLTAAAIEARISAKAVAETVLLHTTVTDQQPRRSLAIANGVADQFKLLVEELETPLGEQVSAVRVEVIAGPRLAPTPVSPRPTRNMVLAVLLGLLVGGALATLREFLDTTVKTTEALTRAVNAPLLATIPLDPAAAQTPVIMDDGKSVARGEALRQLRTNLRVVDVDKPVVSVAITSAVPGEGKSSTAVNLAIVLADSGRRTLLIDADLRRPRIAEYLGIEGAVGLTDVLVGPASFADVAQQWGHAGLHVLPSGFIPPNPSELLGSRQMKELLDQLRDRYDIIVVDVPPLLPVTDAAVVAGRVDGCILVTRCGKTTRGQAESAATALCAVDARLLGCVLNMVPSRGSGNGGYDYGYQYGYNAHRLRAGLRTEPTANRRLGDGRGGRSRAPADTTLSTRS